jgi:hypothetical protein
MEVRKCRYCERKLVKRDHEAEGAFKKRVYCNTDCAVKGSRQLKHWRDYYLPIRTDEIT